MISRSSPSMTIFIDDSLFSFFVASAQNWKIIAEKIKIVIKKKFTGNRCDGKCEHNKCEFIEFTSKFIHLYVLYKFFFVVFHTKFIATFFSRSRFFFRILHFTFARFTWARRKKEKNEKFLYTATIYLMYFIVFFSFILLKSISLRILTSYCRFPIHVTFATRSTPDWNCLICFFQHEKKNKKEKYNSLKTANTKRDRRNVKC